MLVLLRDCDECGQPEERLLTDTYTGKELCVGCLLPILPRLALSPQSECDNLPELLRGDI